MSLFKHDFPILEYDTEQKASIMPIRKVVEMECSALAACAKFRNVTWAILFFTADTLADPKDYQEREGEGKCIYGITISFRSCDIDRRKGGQVWNTN